MNNRERKPSRRSRLKETPATVAAGQGLNEISRFDALTVAYTNPAARAMTAYTIGPDLVIQSFAFSAAVLS